MSNFVLNGSGTLTTDIILANISSPANITITGYTSIDYSAFRNNLNLISVIIGNSVTSIGDIAFLNCSNLTKVTIGNSVVSIGNNTFAGCLNLTTVTFISTSTLTTIGYNAFNQCSSLTSIIIPDSVTSIGNEAFAYCSSLTTVTIGNSVETIGNEAFLSCLNLQKLLIGNSVKTIGNSAFQSCALTSITIPDSVENMGNQVFAYMGLTTVQINDQSKLTTLGSNIFTNLLNNSNIIFYNTTTLTTNGQTIANYFNVNYRTYYELLPPPTFILPIISVNGDAGTTVNITNYVKSNSDGQLSYSSDDSTKADVIGNTLYFYNIGTTNIRVSQDTTINYSAGNTYFEITVNESIVSEIVVGNKRVFRGDSITIVPTSNNSGVYSYSSSNSNVSINQNVIRGLDVGTATITVTQEASGNYLAGTTTFQLAVYYFYCLKEGTNILTEEGYVPIEELNQTHKLKTLNGYKKVYGLRINEIEHKCKEERIADQLYVCRKGEYPDLTEELVMTGRHGILENGFKDGEQVEKVKKVMGKLSSTGYKVRVPVCVDERSKVYEVQGTYKIYHVAVENDNRRINDGIYANGLLVESCSMDDIIN